MINSFRLSGTALCFCAVLYPPRGGAQPPTPADSIVVTQHQVTVGGRVIRYTARAGLLPLRENDTGKLMARMFFVSYTADRAPGEPARPLTFLWNGGPGANSGQVHVVGFGPKRIRTADTYPTWGPDRETVLVDHDLTWLDTSDLVFVDPIGTGFSRATSMEYRDILYTTRGDIEAVAEFIRLYRTRFNAWDSPLFIGGESYGTTRAMGVAEVLEARRTRIAGVMLISGSFNMGQSLPPSLNQALSVPMYAAAAHYHKRLPADLQRLSEDDVVRQATEWVRSEYAPALARRDSLTAAQRSALLAQLRRYTGVDSRFVNERSLLLSKDAFADQLLADRGLELGRYDFRMTTRARRADVQWLPLADPSLIPMMDLMQGTSVAFNSYIRDTLKYRNDLLYRGPFGGAFHPRPLALNPIGIASDWMTLMWNRASAPAAAGAPGAQAAAAPSQSPPLRRAMELNPNVLVWNSRGKYDTACAALDAAVGSLEPRFRSRIRSTCYTGGHMFYSDRQARADMKKDFVAFVADALAASRRTDR